MKTISQRSKVIAIALAMTTMLFFTVNPAYSGFAESETKAKQAVQVLEELVETGDVITDTYSTKDDIVVSDGKEALVKIPRDGTDGVSIGDGLDSKLTLGLPEDLVEDADVEVSDEGTVSYYKEDAPAGIAIQPIEDEGLEGVRATILINDATASHSYDFELEVGEGGKVVTAAEYLGKEYDTGEVYVIDEKTNEIAQAIEPAWAKDANGNPVPTHYELNGNVLTQVIDFDKNTAFPVVADPTVLQIAACALAIAWVVASNVLFPAAKIAKVKALIKVLGGVSKTAKLTGQLYLSYRKYVAGKITKNAFVAKCGSAASSLLNLFSAFLGIDRMSSACSW